MEKRKSKQLYAKLFWTYAIIILCIVSALTLYFISVSRKRILQENLRAMERINSAASEYVRETERIADYIHQDLYRSDSELEDLLRYFTLDPAAYQEYTLDRYSTSGELVYKGIFNFITEAFEAYDELERVELIGYEDYRMTQCYPDKIIYPGKNGMNQVRRQHLKECAEKEKLVYLREIKNPSNMELAGCIIFTFDGREQFEKQLQENKYTEMAVVANNGTVIFQHTKNGDWEILASDGNHLTRKEILNDYDIYTFINKESAESLASESVLTILLMGVLVVFIGMAYVEHYVRRLTSRVGSILDAMNQVTTGNLQVRINPESNSDELYMIASKFDEMCEKLELYIQKSYLAEIERKNAQMQALQSQINPHFLYNTLEAIRMKAICNGDREVGKMLYSMIVLFRSQLKEADIITLGQELDYCKQYMELFQYRYKGSFECFVECVPEYLSLPIIKFVLQPIIENYFIHGIERERTDNKVHIWAEKKEECLCLYVEDNGRGMDAEALDRKNQELKENLPGGKKSIGIMNVNRRIKAVYGDEYGISLQASEPKGLRVTVTIKTE